MASFTSINYSHPVFPFVIPGRQLSFPVQPTLETQVTLIAQALEAHTHATGYGLPVNSTFTTAVVTAASTTGGAGLRLPHGAAPTSPVNGDIWTTTLGAFIRINGVTRSINLT